MADNVEILNIDATESIKTIALLKAELKAFKGELENAKVGSEQYNNALKNVNKVQDELKEATNASSLSLEEARTKIDTTDKSYNELSATMRELKKAFKSATDETAKADISANVDKINDRLKELDASNGVFSRNVGNYAGGIKDAMDTFGGSVGNVSGAFGKLKMAFNTIVAHPIMLLIAGVVTVIKTIVDAIKRNEEATMSLKESFSAFNPVLDLVKRGFEALGMVVVKVVDGIMSAVKWIGEALSDSYADAAEKAEKLAKAENDIIKRERVFAVERAKLEAEVSDLKAKAAEKDKYTNKERLAYLDEALKKEKKIANEEYAIAEEKFRIAKANSERSANDATTNEALAEAEANLYKARKAHSDKTKELNAQRVEAINAMKAEEKAATDAMKEENKRKQEAEIQHRKAMFALYQQEKADRERFYNELQAQDEAEQKRQKEERQKMYDEAVSLNLGIPQDIQDEATAETQAYFDKLNEEIRNGINILNMNRLRSFSDVNAEISKLRIEDFASEEEYKEKYKALQGEKMAIASVYLQQTAGLMTAVSDIMESQGKNDRKSFENQKKVKTATAIVNTLAAGVNAMASVPYPASLIALATTVATGFANVTKIQNQKFDGGGSTGGASTGVTSPVSSQAIVSAPKVDNTLATVQTISTDTAKPQTNKVYILESDLQASGTKANTREADSTF
jgi:hypothetical protein